MEINRNYPQAGNASYEPAENRNLRQAAPNIQNTTETQQQSTVANSPAAIYESTRNTQEARNYRPDMNTVSQMMRDSQQQVESFRRMIETLFERQGITAREAIGIMQSGDFVVSDEVRAAAQEAISEDGYFGVARTAERIVGFAQAISGGDPSRIEELRDAVQRAFDSVADMFGGELPEISQQTWEAVMQGFDDWAQQSVL